MSPTHRLPEDAAAEMAYLAELHGQQVAAEQRRAESRRALMEGHPPSPTKAASLPDAHAKTDGADGDSMLAGISPEQLLHLSPEILAGLPKDVQAAVEAARARKTHAVAGAPRPAEVATFEQQDEAARAEEVLRRVNTELYETDSVLVASPKRASFVQSVGHFLDGLVGTLTRRGPW